VEEVQIKFRKVARYEGIQGKSGRTQQLLKLGNGYSLNPWCSRSNFGFQWAGECVTLQKLLSRRTVEQKYQTQGHCDLLFSKTTMPAFEKYV